jgi:hypothetical protein
MSITRFSLDTPRLPVLAIQPINKTPFVPNDTVYFVGIEVVNRSSRAVISSATKNISWIPEDATLPVPTSYPGVTAKLPYYHCHSYNYFLSEVNTALTKLLQTNSIVNSFRGNIFPPLFSWDRDSQSIVLYCNQLFNEYPQPLAIGDLKNNDNLTNAGIPLVRITMNEHLYALFAGFASTFNPTTGLYSLRIFNTNYPNEAYRNYLLDYTPPSGTNTPPYANSLPAWDESQDSIVPPTGSTNFRHVAEGIFLIVKSEITGCDLWSPVASIVFTTSLIPIVSNQLSSPIIYEDGIINNVNQSANFAQVITDFISSEQGMRPNILYNPTAEYRRIQLYGNSPLTNFDISVFWKSKYGEFIPFVLSPGATASIKILFEKKKNKIVV